MLTTFAQRGAELVNSTPAGIVSTCSLAATMVVAVVVDPAASMIAIVARRFGVASPASAVKREARRTKTAGMDFATLLSETSQLGMETTRRRVREPEPIVDLIERNQATTQRLSLSPWPRAGGVHLDGLSGARSLLQQSQP